MTCARHTAAGFEIRFQSLFSEGRALAFLCDSQGHVDLDAASERERNEYLFARAMVGREYAVPELRTNSASGH